MEITLTAQPRTGTGKGVARKLRVAGLVPCVLYGRGIEATPVTVDRRALTNALTTKAGGNVLVDLQLGDTTHLTLAREVQRDVLRGVVTHVDFLRISRDEEIEVDVPIHVVGESPGVKQGGVIEHHLWSVRVSCLPGNVPERVAADVSVLSLGERLRVGDLRPGEGVTMLTDTEETVLSVVVPQILKVAEEVAPVEAAAGEAAAAEAAAPAEGAPEE